jgi:hypothetical protein
MLSPLLSRIAVSRARLMLRRAASCPLSYGDLPFRAEQLAEMFKLMWETSGKADPKLAHQIQSQKLNVCV